MVFQSGSVLTKPFGLIKNLTKWLGHIFLVWFGFGWVGSVWLPTPSVNK